MRSVVIHAPHDLRVEAYPHALADLAAGHVRVRMAAGGICGSDLHYYHHGGFGTVRVKQPMTLGHEASGYVEAVGAGVASLAVGDLVAVNPSLPCATCAWCEAGTPRHCENMLFNGSAMRFPHVQGLFRAAIDIPAPRAVRMPQGLAPEVAALAEPLAVALHALNQAGDVTGKRVLVSGCGPIGILVTIAAKLAGARQIIVTDITQHCLETAATCGADLCINVAEQPAALADYAAGRGTIDVAFECSGNPAATCGAAMTLLPGGRMVLVGLGGDPTLPVNTLVAREISLVGTFRFDREFDAAAALIASRRFDFARVVSATYPVSDAVAAFEHASERKRAIKVALRLDA
jgi:L-idonate 5-dehydrogenase